MPGLQGPVALKPSKARARNVGSQKSVFIAVLGPVNQLTFLEQSFLITLKIGISAKLFKVSGNLQGFTKLLAMLNV